MGWGVADRQTPNTKDWLRGWGFLINSSFPLKTDFFRKIFGYVGGPWPSTEQECMAMHNFYWKENIVWGVFYLGAWG